MFTGSAAVSGRWRGKAAELVGEPLDAEALA
jgi:hypothetical protein